MNSQEYDQIEEAANRLQHEASVKCSRELEKAQKYKEGYEQGITKENPGRMETDICVRHACIEVAGIKQETAVISR